MKIVEPQINKFSLNNTEVLLIKTDKFKSLYIETKFEGEFTTKTASEKELLSHIMETANNSYKTKEEVANKCFDLYDASVEVSTNVSDDVIMTSFSLEVIDYNIINNPELLKEAVLFYNEFIYNPYVENGKFNEGLFNEKRKLVIHSIGKLYNNKTRYAIRKTLEHMCKDENISIPVYGTIEEINKITPESLYQSYLDMINNEKKSIVICGNIDKEQVISLLESCNHESNKVCNKRFKGYSDRITIAPKIVHELYEVQKISQSKLVMGYRTNIGVKDELYHASLIFNAIFGGSYNSVIINRVRDEMSMAYSISSSIFPINKLLIVTAGIDKDNYQVVVNTICEELDKMKQGIIDETLFKNAISITISDLNGILDSNYQLSGFYFNQEYYDSHKSIEKIIDEISKVTIEEVVEVSNKIYLDTIFLLKGDENEED